MNKILGTLIGGTLMLGLVLGGFPISKAEARHSGWNGRDGYHKSMKHMKYKKFHKKVRFIGDENYYKKYYKNYHKNYGNKYFKNYYKDWRRDCYPRNLVLFDRDFGDSIVLSNRLTGPFSRNVNVVKLGMSHGDFTRIVNDIEISNDIDIDASTGNNDVSFNTVVGRVSTGDIDIDVDVENL